MPIYPYKEGYLAYDRYANSISFIKNERDFFESQPQSNNTNAEKLSKYSYYVEKSEIDKTITLVFITTYNCNFRCKYCYEFTNSDTDLNQFKLPSSFNAEGMLQVFMSFVEEYPNAMYRINFFGGEPLIEGETIFNFIAIANKYCNDNGIPLPEYGAISNGSLLDESTCKQIVEHFSGITISLDGIKCINDKNRILEDGSGSFDLVYSNIKRLKEIDTEHRLLLACEATLTADFFANSSPDAIAANYSLFKSLFDTVGIIPVNGKKRQLFLDDLNAEQAISELFGLWVGDILSNNPPLKIISFENIIAGFAGKNKHGVKCTAGEGYYAIAPDMSIYPCQVSIFSDRCTLGEVDKANSKLKIDTSPLKQYIDMADNSLCRDCECSNICGSYCKVVMSESQYIDNCIFNKIILKVAVTKMYELNNSNLLDKFVKNFVSLFRKL